MNDRLNTIFGWLLASAGVALGASIVSGIYFHANSPELAEGVTPGYVIDVPEGDGAAGESIEPIGNRLAVADIAAGEAAFARCISCHTIAPGPSGLGPNLNGVIGAGIGSSASDFSYSSALSSHGGNWTYEALDEWLASPSAFIPGNQMSFPGLSDPQARADLIAYLHANGGGGPEFPAPVEAAPEGDGVTDVADQNQPAEQAGAVSADEAVPSANAATANQ